MGLNLAILASASYTADLTTETVAPAASTTETTAETPTPFSLPEQTSTTADTTGSLPDESGASAQATTCTDDTEMAAEVENTSDEADAIQQFLQQSDSDWQTRWGSSTALDTTETLTEDTPLPTPPVENETASTGETPSAPNNESATPRSETLTVPADLTDTENSTDNTATSADETSLTASLLLDTVSDSDAANTQASTNTTKSKTPLNAEITIDSSMLSALWSLPTQTQSLATTLTSSATTATTPLASTTEAIAASTTPSSLAMALSDAASDVESNALSAIKTKTDNQTPTNSNVATAASSLFSLNQSTQQTSLTRSTSNDTLAFQLGQQMLETLKDQVETQLSQNIKQTTIRLDPPSLGHLNITVSLSNDRLTVQINASHDGLRQALEQSKQELQQVLATDNQGGVDVQVGQDSSDQDTQSRWALTEDAIQKNVTAAANSVNSETTTASYDWLNTVV